MLGELNDQNSYAESTPGYDSVRLTSGLLHATVPYRFLSVFMIIVTCHCSDIVLVFYFSVAIS